MSVERLWRLYPHCLPAALCAGLVLADLIRLTRGPALCVAAGGLAVALAGRGTGTLLTGALLVVVAGGWWWGSTRLDALDSSVLTGYVQRADRMRVVITGPPRHGQFEVRAPARAERFGELRLNEPILLELPLGRSPPQGARISLVGEVKLPHGPEKGFDERTWLRRQGIQVVVRGGPWRVVGRRGGIGGVSDRLRAWLVGSSTPGLEGERRAVLVGVVLGADEGLSQSLRQSFRASGLYHLLAVSGQNVAFLAAGVLMFAWLVGIPRWLGEVGVLAVIAGYTLAVGWQPSVVRAAVAGSLASLAWLAARPRDRWYFLLLGAAVLLAWNPYSFLEPGFQLSFAAVVAIFVLVPRLEHWLAGYPVPRPLATALAVSTACGVLTAPVLLLQFGKVPLYSVVSNALVTPVVAPLLGLGLVAALLNPVLPSAAAALAWVNGWCAAYLIACARVVAALPYAQVGSLTAAAWLTLAGSVAWLLVRLRRDP